MVCSTALAASFYTQIEWWYESSSNVAAASSSPFFVLVVCFFFLLPFSCFISRRRLLWLRLRYMIGQERNLVWVLWRWTRLVLSLGSAYIGYEWRSVWLCSCFIISGSNRGSSGLLIKLLIFYFVKASLFPCHFIVFICLIVAEMSKALSCDLWGNHVTLF